MTASELSRRWTDAGLFDPTTPQADEQLEVFAFYESIGITASTFTDLDLSNPISDINERILVPGERFGSEAVRTRLGLTADEFDALRQASGYSADDTYTDVDIESFSGFLTARDFFSPDELLSFTRTLSATMENLADASVSLFRIDVASEMDRSGATEVDFARKNHESSAILQNLFVPMQAVFLRQLLNAIRRNDEARITDHTDGLSSLNMAVGFVDIVGFTTRTEKMNPGELDQFIQGFEQEAFRVVNELGGRVVKLIGDEVMFIDSNATNAVRIAAGLIEAFDDIDALPRAGVAFGELISRGGDYYGRVVNLAARLTGRAEAGQIMSDGESILAMTDEVQTTQLGAMMLKGFTAETNLAAVAIAETPGSGNRTPF